MTNVTSMDWPDRLKKIIDERGMGVPKLAEETGFTKEFFYQYFNRKRINIREDDFNKIAAFLGLHPAELRYGVDFTIDTPYFFRCFTAIQRAARNKKARLNEDQRLRSTIALYNFTIKSKIVSNTKALEVIELFGIDSEPD